MAKKNVTLLTCSDTVVILRFFASGWPSNFESWTPGVRDPIILN
jgi:hypothetical protein